MVTCPPYVIISLICPKWLTRIFPTECPHSLTITGPIICPHTKKTFFPFICSHTIHMMDSWKYSPYGWSATIQLASRFPTIRHYMVGPLPYSWLVASHLLGTICLDCCHIVASVFIYYHRSTHIATALASTKRVSSIPPQSIHTSSVAVGGLPMSMIPGALLGVATCFFCYSNCHSPGNHHSVANPSKSR